MLDGLKDKCSVAAIFLSRLFGPTKQNLRNTSGVTALCKTANFWPVKLFPDGVHNAKLKGSTKKSRTLLANSKDIRRYPIYLYPSKLTGAISIADENRMGMKKN